MDETRDKPSGPVTERMGPGAAFSERCQSLTASATLAAAGGYLDGFTYVGHGHVFANAMTGNVVLLGVDAVSRSWSDSLRHFLPILMFLAGVATSRVARLPAIRRRHRRPELVVLVVEIVTLFGLGWLPATTSDLLITMSIAFAASLQMATFREIEGRPYSSTFTTGNLRTMAENGFDWLFLGRQRSHLLATRDFATICAMFLIGAAAGAFATPRLHNRTLWVDVVVLPILAVWLFAERRELRSKEGQ